MMLSMYSDYEVLRELMIFEAGDNIRRCYICYFCNKNCLFSIELEMTIQ